MAQKQIILRTIVDKKIVPQPHHHELGYILELEPTALSKVLKAANDVVITQRDYMLLQIGSRFAQRIK